MISNILDKNKNRIREHYELKETIVTIISDGSNHIKIAKNEIKRVRAELESFIRNDSFFKVTLEPYEYKEDAPEIIKKMSDSSRKFGIGPMSTVAGLIAEYAVKAMIENGAEYAIVDNGGDIAIFSDDFVNVGIYTGNKSTNRFAFKIKPSNEITSVCTSSGKIGHSISFGNSDAAIVFSNDTIIADAGATALGNRVKTEKDIKSCFNIFKNIKEIQGAVVFLDQTIGLWGKIPEIIVADIPSDLITKGEIL